VRRANLTGLKIQKTTENEADLGEAVNKKVEIHKGLKQGDIVSLNQNIGGLKNGGEGKLGKEKNREDCGKNGKLWKKVKNSGSCL